MCYLVTDNGKVIDSESFDVDFNLGDGLSSVGMHEHGAEAALGPGRAQCGNSLADLTNRLKEKVFEAF
jgi:hypothetical protein